MSDWREHAELSGDVAFFNYFEPQAQREAELVFVWDVDKTYLDTKFESLGGLWRALAEKAFQKKNVPGTAVLVRALRDTWLERRANVKPIFFFITATPPQLEHRIREKLRLDGIYPAGIFFKDNLQNINPRRWWRLTKQVGFKIQALMQMRLRLGENVRQILWGDDSEQDAVIYSLYADICARRISPEDLDRVLNYFYVTGAQIDEIVALQNLVTANDPVEKIYINLATDTDAEYYLKFGKRVVPSYNTFQTALDLYQMNHLSLDQVVGVAMDLRENFLFTSEELERSFDDLVRRQVLYKDAVDKLLPKLAEVGLFHAHFVPSVKAATVETKMDAASDPWIPERIDYTHDYR